METNSGELQRRGLIAMFANNPVAANLLMAIFLVGGLIAAFGLNAQVFPTIDPGVITVTVPYPGATPTEVEEGITRRVEEAVIGIDGIDRVVSRAAENVGVVTIELKDRVDAARVRNDVETAVDRLAEFPPEDAEDPDIVRAETVSDVLTLVVSADAGEAELRKGAERLEEALLALPKISLVSLQGARDYEIAIEVSEDALRRYDLTIDQVARAIRLSSLNLSSGELRTRAGDVLLRTNSKRERGAEFEDIVLRSESDGTLLRLGDVATVTDGFADVDLISEFDGRPSVFLNVKKSDAEDALEIAAEVRSFLASFDPGPGIEVQVWNDQTEVLESRLSLLLRNGLLGFALVFLFLVVMLDLRLALWVAMGVPISFLGAFLIFDFYGVSINMISLFALIIVLGVVVDDAVVVGENIVAEQEAGKRGIEGAIAGVRGVLGPVLVGVLTTMAAFAPLAFATGTFGQILGVVPIVVIAVLTVSLIEVFFILPSHLAHDGTWSRGALARFQGAIGCGIQSFRDRRVVPAVAWAVRHRFRTLFTGAAMLALALGFLATGAVRFIFFPALEADSISASLEMPIGTPFDITEQAARRIADAARAVDADLGGGVFESISVTVGGKVRRGGGPGGNTGTSISSHSASIRIQLAADGRAELSAVQLERLWRKRVGAVAGAESLSFDSEIFSAGPAIDYELSHADDGALVDAVEALKGRLAMLDGVSEVADSFSAGKRQYDVELTPAGEAAGLKPADVARQLRQSFFGAEVQRIQRGRQELKVMVRYPRDERSSTADLFNVRIRLPDGSQAPLSAVARIVESRSFAEINRVDGRRVVSVSGKVDTVLATPGEINGYIKSALLPQITADFPGLSIGEGGFGREQSRDLASLGRTMLIAMMIIYALLASQLKSYAQPLVILAGVPFGAAGAVIGHYLLGYDLSFISIFGMVALSGVVVNDSLVLVDRYNYLRRTTSMSAEEAVVAASQRRFRAIFLTTLTTALGLMPMLAETSMQARFLVPMAVSLATGIVFSSVVILFLVPTLVLTIDLRRERRAERRLAKRGGLPAAA